MNKKQISLKLKELRRNNKLTIEEVKELLAERDINVAVKTIYGWESGKRLPYPDIFLTLCDIYNVEDILITFGIREDNYKIEPKMIAREDGLNKLDMGEELGRFNESTSLVTSDINLL